MLSLGIRGQIYLRAAAEVFRGHRDIAGVNRIIGIPCIIVIGKQGMWRSVFSVKVCMCPLAMLRTYFNEINHVMCKGAVHRENGADNC